MKVVAFWSEQWTVGHREKLAGRMNTAPPVFLMVGISMSGPDTPYLLARTLKTVRLGRIQIQKSGKRQLVQKCAAPTVDF